MPTNYFPRVIVSHVFAVAIFCTAAVSIAADFSGSYKTDQFTMEIFAASAGSYTGVIHTGSEDYPLKAQVDSSGKLQGTFTSHDRDFVFTADLGGDELTMLTGGNTLKFERLGSAPANGAGFGTEFAPSTRSANGDDPVALTTEGNKYFHAIGVPEDDARALQLFQRAADDGFPIAMNQLASMYRLGKGTPQNYPMAFHWFLKGAQAGGVAAEKNVGGMYERGLGTPVDYVQAMIWYRKAADSGDANAMDSVGKMYDLGKGVPEDPRPVFFWYQKSAQAGSPFGMVDVAWCYENGVGVNADLDQAKAWLQKAADLGSDEAKKELAAFPATSAAAITAATAPSDSPVQMMPGFSIYSQSMPSMLADLQPNEKVTIDVDAGRIEVISWDRPQVRVTFRKMLDEKDPQNAAVYKRFNLISAYENGELKFSAKLDPNTPQNASGSDPSLTGKAYVYQILAPRNCRIELNNTTGAISVSGLSGPITANSPANDITVAIPADAAFTLDASARTVNCDFPLPATNNLSRAHADINGGGPLVQLKSQTGSVNIIKQ